jgi:hypothetical protein
MNDLKERLLERSQNLWTSDKELKDNKLFKEAADEIERLERVQKIVDTLMKDMAQ